MTGQVNAKATEDLLKLLAGHQGSDGEKIKSEDLENLINQGADVNAKDKEGCTPLRLVACFGNKRLAEILLNHGADPNEKNENKDFITILMEAASIGGNAGLVDLLLSKGADRDAVDRGGNTALMYAANTDSEKIIEALLATTKASDINEQDKCGRTALMHAALDGRVAAVKALLIAGAAIEMKDNEGKTALDHARTCLGSFDVRKAVITLIQDKMNGKDISSFSTQKFVSQRWRWRWTEWMPDRPKSGLLKALQDKFSRDTKKLELLSGIMKVLGILAIPVKAGWYLLSQLYKKLNLHLNTKRNFDFELDLQHSLSYGWDEFLGIPDTTRDKYFSKLKYIGHISTKEIPRNVINEIPQNDILGERAVISKNTYVKLPRDVRDKVSGCFIK